MSLERIAPTHAATCSLVNTIFTHETLDGVHSCLANEKVRQKSTHFLDKWNATPNRLKRELLWQYYNRVHELLVQRGTANSEDYIHRPTMEQMVSALRTSELHEEWVELGQLAAYITRGRVTKTDTVSFSNTEIQKLLLKLAENSVHQGKYMRPNLEVMQQRVSSNLVVQALDNLIGNGHDALVPEKQIGMFASGVKCLAALLEPGNGEVTVVSKTMEKQEQVLRMRRSVAGRLFVNVVPKSKLRDSSLHTIDSPTGTYVRITGLKFSKAKKRAILESIAFSSGITPEGVKIIIQGLRPPGKRRCTIWGNETAETQALGHVIVRISSTEIIVQDDGCGMSEEQLHRLFVPRQGTKSVQLLQSNEAENVVRQNGYIKAVRFAENSTALPTVVLQRRGEALQKIQIPQTYGYFAGTIYLEMDAALRPLGEGRAQSGASIDENFSISINILLDKLLNSNSNLETKAIILSTILGACAVLDQRASEGQSLTEATRIIRITEKRILEKAAPLIKALSKTHQLIPNSATYERLVINSEKPVCVMHAKLLRYNHVFDMLGMSRPLSKESGISPTSTYSVFAATIKADRSLATGVHSQTLSNSLALGLQDGGSAVLPVIIDHTFKHVIFDKQYIEAYEAMFNRGISQGFSDEELHQFNLFRECLLGLLNEAVETCYEISHQKKIVKPVSLLTIKDGRELVGLKTKNNSAFLERDTADLKDKEWVFGKTGSYIESIAHQLDEIGVDYGSSELLPLGVHHKLRSIPTRIPLDNITRVHLVANEEFRAIDKIISFKQDGIQYCLVEADRNLEIFVWNPERKMLELVPGSCSIQLKSVYTQIDTIEIFGRRYISVVNPRKETAVIYALNDLIAGKDQEGQSGKILFPPEIVHSILDKWSVCKMNNSLAIVRVGRQTISPHNFSVIVFTFSEQHGAFTQFGTTLYFPGDYLTHTVLESNDSKMHILMGSVAAENNQLGAYNLSRYSLDAMGTWTMTSDNMIHAQEYKNFPRSIRQFTYENSSYALSLSKSGRVELTRCGVGDISSTKDMVCLLEIEVDRYSTSLAIMDIYENFVVITNSDTGCVHVLEIDLECMQLVAHASRQITAATLDGDIRAIHSAQFLKTQEGVRILYHVPPVTCGFLDVRKEDGVLKLEQIIDSGHEKYLEIYKEYIALLQLPEYQSFPLAARQTFEEKMIFCFYFQDETKKILQALQQLLEKMKSFQLFNPELEQYIESLATQSSNSDTESTFAENMLVRLMEVFAQSIRLTERVHWEYSLTNTVGRDSISVLSFIESLKLDEKLPLLEERILVYSGIDICIWGYYLRMHDDLQLFNTKLTGLYQRLSLLLEKGILVEFCTALKAQVKNQHTYNNYTEILSKLDSQTAAYYQYVMENVEIVRINEEPLVLPLDRYIPVSALAYYSKVAGLQSMDAIESAVRRQQGRTIANFSELDLDLSEFDTDWRIAVYFSGGSGVEQRELIQNSDDAIQRRKLLYGDVEAGSIDYDFYTQAVHINGQTETYFVYEVLDNGCGMSDFARICFAVSGLSDKKQFGSAQSGEFGMGLASIYQSAKLVVVDTVRVTNPATMKKGSARDVYIVERNEAGYAQRLILVHSSTQDDIDAQCDLGTRIRILQPENQVESNVDAMIIKNTARKLGWFTQVTSANRKQTKNSVPVLFYERFMDRDDAAWQRRSVEVAGEHALTLDCGGGRYVSAYTSDVAGASHVTLDGRLLSARQSSLLNAVPKRIFSLISKYHLRFDLHGFAPVIDRGSVMDEEVAQSAIAELVIRFSSYKMLTDSSYLPEGMPVDFHTNLNYLTTFESMNANLYRLIRNCNIDKRMNREDVEQCNDPNRVDEFNFLLCCLEHNLPNDLRMSVFARRALAFIATHDGSQDSDGIFNSQTYSGGAERAYSNLLRLVASPKLLSQEQRVPRYWQRLVDDELRDAEIESNGMEDVTKLFEQTTLYNFLVKIFANLGVKPPIVLHSPPFDGRADLLSKMVWLSDNVMNRSDVYGKSVHELAHLIERHLKILTGLGSSFTHQQTGAGFPLAYKLVSWNIIEQLIAMEELQTKL